MRLIYFGACWCPSCLVMRSVYTKLSKEKEDVEFIEYDYDLDVELVQKYNIGEVLPEVILIDKNDNELFRFIGEKSYKEILKKIHLNRVGEV